MIELIQELKVQNTLGEGVIWDSASQRLWWTDIDEKKLFQYDPATQTMEFWQTPERLSCLSPLVINGLAQDYLVVAFESGFAYFHPTTGRVEWIKKIERNNPGTRLNDGRTDRQGRFWAGTMVEDHRLANAKGKLYCLHQDLNLTTTLQELSITNSLCWSPDSKTLYHCDTPSQIINRYDFEPDSGRLSNATIFAQTEKGCYPDGSTVDSAGYLWNAQWGGSKVVRYAPDGSVNLMLDLPVSQPTCVAFGGKDLDLLFVTTAHQGFDQQQRAEHPRAGNLFIYRTSFVGLAETPFMPSTKNGISSQT